MGHIKWVKQRKQEGRKEGRNITSRIILILLIIIIIKGVVVVVVVVVVAVTVGEVLLVLSGQA